MAERHMERERSAHKQYAGIIMGIMVEHPDIYFGQWVPSRSGHLQALESEAEQHEIPIVGPVVGKLLYLLAKLQGACHIVELGTATGYSAIYMANACRSNHGRVTTFEIDPEMAARATRNIEKSGLTQWVDVQCQDALKGLNAIAEPVDMIFLDIEKVDYVHALPLCEDKLGPNGLLVADNTGFKDAHEFNQAIFENANWESVNLWSFLPGHSPENDGLCIALKRS
jgi:caffeoyl-CoA O-methyltransferase